MAKRDDGTVYLMKRMDGQYEPGGKGRDLERPLSVAPDSKIRQAPLQRQTTRHPWTREDDTTLRNMKKEACSWEEIQCAIRQS